MSALTVTGPSGSGSVALALVTRAGRFLVTLAVSSAVVLGLWLLFLRVFDLSPFFAKSPIDVWHYLFGGTKVDAAKAAGNRSEILSAVGTTARDAVLGYVFGTVAAVAAALSVVGSRAVERGVMPIAIALRSVPLVAMTPLIALIFGRGLLGVTVIAGIVTFFPTLVNVVAGLRAAPALAVDVVVAYGGTTPTVLRKVALPAALPSLFASARIAVPGALLGAVLAEWLATGKGLGALMLSCTTNSRFDTLWSSVVVITVLSIAVYALIGMVESFVLARMGDPSARR
jgi:ABC-type nitrate/sulfonate/bicarbonate transport system permease component